MNTPQMFPDENDLLGFDKNTPIGRAEQLASAMDEESANEPMSDDAEQLPPSED